MKVTFKIHKVDKRDIVEGDNRCELLTLHPIDPHEKGFTEHAIESRSGEGKIQLKVTNPRMLGRFPLGKLITVTFEE